MAHASDQRGMTRAGIQRLGRSGGLASKRLDFPGLSLMERSVRKLKSLHEERVHDPDQSFPCPSLGYLGGASVIPHCRLSCKVVSPAHVESLMLIFSPYLGDVPNENVRMILKIAPRDAFGKNVRRRWTA